MADGFDMPIVELRIKHLGQQLINAFVMHENELGGYIKKSVEALMTNEYIQEEIDRLCHECLKECIQEVFDSHIVKRKLIDIMTEQVLARINEAPPIQCQPIILPSDAPTGTGAPLPQQPIVTAQSEDDLQSEDDFWTSVKSLKKGTSDAEG